jgi:glc operon protein GlcG
MPISFRNALACIAAIALMASTTLNHAADPPQYGTPITNEQAKKAMAAAEAEAKKQNWPVAISIVDTHGFLVMFQKLDNTQLGSVDLSLEKAKASAQFRRTTKTFEDTLDLGGRNLRVLKHPAMIIEGGVPILVDGKVIGAIGVSGVKSDEDAIVAQAGADVLKTPAK